MVGCVSSDAETGVSRSMSSQGNGAAGSRCDRSQAGSTRECGCATDPRNCIENNCTSSAGLLAEKGSFSPSVQRTGRKNVNCDIMCAHSREIDEEYHGNSDQEVYRPARQPRHLRCRHVNSYTRSISMAGCTARRARGTFIVEPATAAITMRYTFTCHTTY
jgi:hypothetical protein